MFSKMKQGLGLALSLAAAARQGHAFQQGCPSEASVFDAGVLNFSVVATVEALTPGFAILEGPVWYEGSLYMSHIGYGDGVNQAPSSIVVLDDDNVIQTHIPDAGTNGMVLTQFPSVIVAAIQGRAGEGGRVGIINFNDAEFEVPLATEFNGLPFNSPNDVAVSSHGAIYFTDPDWQAPIPPPQPAELAYYKGAFDTEVTSFASNIEKPNGILLSADETRIFVGGVNGLFVFPLDGDAVVDEPEQLHSDTISGGVDGMTRDCVGNVYLTANGVVHVLDRESDEILASVEVPSVTNLAFGGDDMTTLYATSLGEVPTLFSSPSAVAGES